MSEKIKILAKKDVENSCILDIQEYLENYLKSHEEKNNSKRIKEIKVEIRTMNKEGDRKKHEFKTKMVTDGDIFHSKKVGWECYPRFKDSMSSINNQIKKYLKEKEKKRHLKGKRMEIID